MHEHLGSFTQNPSQKFQKNFINFEKPQNLSLMHEMHEEWRIKDPYQKGRTRSKPKKTWEWSLEWERKVLGGEEMRSVERDWGKWEKRSRWPYI